MCLFAKTVTLKKEAWIAWPLSRKVFVSISFFAAKNKVIRGDRQDQESFVAISRFVAHYFLILSEKDVIVKSCISLNPLLESS